MSIFAAAAVPTFVDSLIFHRVESAARRLKADLELLRKTARLTSRVQIIEFKGLPNQAAYEAVDDSDVHDLVHPSEPYSVKFWKEPYEIENVTIEADGDDSRISFDGYGTPSTVDAFGTHTPLENRVDIRLQAGEFECIVSINSLGEVTKGDTVEP